MVVIRTSLSCGNIWYGLKEQGKYFETKTTRKLKTFRLENFRSLNGRYKNQCRQEEKTPKFFYTKRLEKCFSSQIRRIGKYSFSLETNNGKCFFDATLKMRVRFKG